MAAFYPGAVKTWAPPRHQDISDTIYATHVIEVEDEVTAIEQTLGTNPQGPYPSVDARLDDLPALFSAAGHNHDHGTLLNLTDDHDAEYPRRDLLTTIGDLPYATAAGTWGRFAAGAAGNVFTANGAGVLPTWQRPIASFTTIQRDALAGAALWVGRVIWNSTTKQVESWDGAAWVSSQERRPISSRFANFGVLSNGSIRVFGAPGAAVTTLYTVPAGAVAYINKLRVANAMASGGGAQTFRIAVNSAGGNALTTATAVAYDVPLAQAETYDLLEGAVLQAGATIVCWAQNANVSFQLDGVLFSAADVQETPKVLAQLLINAGDVDRVLYTVPAGKTAVIGHLHVANVASATPSRFTLFDPNWRTADQSVSRYEHARWLEGTIYPAGTVVTVRSGDVNTICCTLFGSEI